LRRLLTEALRQRDEHYFKGIKDVRMIRCMAHHKVPAFNSMEANGGECAVCVVDDIGKARDATIREVEQWKAKAIRVSGEADALERERDEAQAKLVEEREAMASISGELVQAQVKVAKERDSYRAALEECGELRSEARERAERAEALLLAREKHNGQ
jgi:septal ring factor EnvC (AmiA/AmiB activator)